MGRNEKTESVFTVVGIIFLILFISGNDDGFSVRFYITYVPAIIFLLIGFFLSIRKR